MYGGQQSVAGDNTSRTVVAAMNGLGILAWIVKRTDPSVVRRVVVLVMFAWFVLKSAAA